MITSDRFNQVRSLSLKLYSNHRIADELRMSRTTVAKILKDFDRPNCPCGRPINHSGWCVTRTELNVLRRAERLQFGRSRRLRRLDASGAGGVAVETHILKAPPKPAQVPMQKPKEEEPPKKTMGFSMQAMRGAFPSRSVARQILAQRHIGHV